MKKSLVTGLAILTLLPQVVAAAAVNMTYNGSPIYADVPPIIRNDRTFVPLRFLSETLGYKVGWDNATRTATVSGKSEIRLTIGKTTALVGGDEKSLDVAPFIEKERTMVPIRFVAENMEGNIAWDEETKTVKLTGPELPKAQPITVTVEGQKVLEIAQPKMVGNTPMIPVGQFVRSIVAARIPEYIKGAEEFRYVYSPASDNQFNSKGLDVYMFGGTQPAEFDGVYFLYSPKYDIFIEPVESPGNVMRTQIHPIAEGDELYLTPDQISHFFWAGLTQNNNIYDFSKEYEKWVMVDDVMSTYWPNYTDEKSIQAAYGDLVRKNHDPFGMGPSYYFKNVPLERYLERVVKKMK